MTEANHNDSGKDILFAITMRQLSYFFFRSAMRAMDKIPGKLPLNLLK